jgi:hypothetical protein
MLGHYHAHEHRGLLPRSTRYGDRREAAQARRLRRVPLPSGANQSHVLMPPSRTHPRYFPATDGPVPP